MGDEGIEELGFETSHLATLDHEEHVPFPHGIAKMPFHPPNAPRHAGRELRDVPLVVVHDATGHQFTHHRPLLDRHQFNAGALHRLLRFEVNGVSLACRRVFVPCLRRCSVFGGGMRGRPMPVGMTAMTSKTERPVCGVPEPADRSEGRRGYDGERPTGQRCDEFDTGDPDTLRAWRHGSGSCFVLGVGRTETNTLWGA